MGLLWWGCGAGGGGGCEGEGGWAARVESNIMSSLSTHVNTLHPGDILGILNVDHLLFWTVP